MTTATPTPTPIPAPANDPVAMPLAVTLRSALSKLDGGPGGARVFVIDGGSGQASRARIVEVIAPDLGRLAGLKTIGHLDALA